MKTIDIIMESGVYTDNLLDCVADDCSLTPAERATLQAKGFVELLDFDAVIVLENEPEQFNVYDSVQYADGGFNRRTFKF